ncbi:hypothetical protein S83_059778, partial [Arachis hypogaea]
MLEPVQFCVGTSSLVVPGTAGYRSQGEVQILKYLFLSNSLIVLWPLLLNRLQSELMALM